MARAQSRSVAPRRGSRPPVAGAPAGVAAFVDVTVIPMDTERVLPRYTVLVEQGRVKALGPSAQVKVPAGATRIDGRGKYLIPGLSDMHLHVPAWQDMAAQPVDSPAVFPYPPKAIEEAERQLFLAVANGVTIVRIMNGRPGTLVLRDQAAKGELLSPRLIVGSPSVLERHQPDTAARIVKAAKVAGYDFIKAYSQDSTWDTTVAVARRLGLTIAGHVPNDRRGIDGAIQAGYRSIEHMYGIEAYLMAHDTAFQGITDIWGEPETHVMPWSPVEDRNLRALGAKLRTAGIWVCPTNIVHYDMGDGVSLSDAERYVYEGSGWRYAKRKAADPPKLPNPPLGSAQLDSLASSAAVKLSAAPQVKRRRLFTKTLHDAGTQLLLGTDVGGTPGFAVHRELAEFVAAGLRPYEALVIATRNAAEFAGWLDDAGTVAVGKRADLVLLDGNPLEDIRRTARPAGVMLGGRWLDRAALDARLQAIEHAAVEP